MKLKRVTDLILESEFARLNEASLKGVPTKEDIIKAIKNRNYVGIYYEGEDEKSVLKGFRLIEPYVFGNGFVSRGTIINKDVLYLRAYVVMDTNKSEDTRREFKLNRRKSVSLSKNKPHWRLFRVDRIKTWFNLERIYMKGRDLYQPDDKNFYNITVSAEK